MAKITIAESVHVDIRLDGKTIERDLVAGDVDVEQEIADLLIAQGLAVVASKGGKKTSSAAVVEENPIPTESSEA